MAYDGRNLSKYLGSRTSALGLVLFWFGGAGLLVSAIVWAWLAGANSQDFPPRVYLTIPVWSLVAVPLGLSLRRGKRPVVWLAFALTWLAIALSLIVAARMGFV